MRQTEVGGCFWSLEDLRKLKSGLLQYHTVVPNPIELMVYHVKTMLVVLFREDFRMLKTFGHSQVSNGNEGMIVCPDINGPRLAEDHRPI